MKYLISILLLASLALADDSSCVASSATKRAIIARDDNLYYRVPASSNSTIRFTRPDSIGDMEGCVVRLKSKLVYRNGTESKIRRFASKKDLVSKRTIWRGPVVRRVRDTIPRGSRIGSILYIAADVVCSDVVTFQTSFVGRYVPNCGLAPTLGSADAYRAWLSPRMR